MSGKEPGTFTDTEDRVGNVHVIAAGARLEPFADRPP